jgi:hypothetical protein
MKEAWDKCEVGAKNIPHREIYSKVFFSEF